MHLMVELSLWMSLAPQQKRPNLRIPRRHLGQGNRTDHFTLSPWMSERELEVLRLLVEGMSNREIAERMVVAVGTVKTHIHNIYGKLSAQNRAQAIARARELGLL